MLGLGGKGDTAVIGPIRRGNSKSYAYRVPILSKLVGVPVRSHKGVTSYDDRFPKSLSIYLQGK